MAAPIDLPIVLPWKYIIVLGIGVALFGLGLLWAGFRLFKGKPILTWDNPASRLGRFIGAKVRGWRSGSQPPTDAESKASVEFAGEDAAEAEGGEAVEETAGEQEPVTADGPDDEEGESGGIYDSVFGDIPTRVVAVSAIIGLVITLAMSIWYVMGAWPFGPWRGFTILGLPAYWVSFFGVLFATMLGLPLYVYFVTPAFRMGSGIIGYFLWVIAAFASGGTIFERGGDGRYHHYPMRQGEHGRPEMFKDGEWRKVDGRIENVSRLGWRPIAFTWEKNEDTLEEIEVTDLGEDPVEYMVSHGVDRQVAEAWRQDILTDGQLRDHEEAAKPRSESRDGGTDTGGERGGKQRPAVADGSGHDPFNSRLGPGDPVPTGSSPSPPNSGEGGAMRAGSDAGAGDGDPGDIGQSDDPEAPPEGYNILDYVGHEFHAFNPWPTGPDDGHVLIDGRKVKMKLEGSAGIKLVEKAKEQALVDTSRTTARNQLVTWGMVFFALIIGIGVALFTVTPG